MLEQRAQDRQRVEALGTLAGGIAHDVGNMLVPITSLSQLLVNEFTPCSDHQDIADKILEAGQRIQALIGEIRIFSRREAVQPMLLRLADEVLQTLPPRLSTPRQLKVTKYSPDATIRSWYKSDRW
jgi:signal transduction histidine kinase